MEIELAQVEMPGLMSMIKEFGAAPPHKGANISGSLHMLSLIHISEPPRPY